MTRWIAVALVSVLTAWHANAQQAGVREPGDSTPPAFGVRGGARVHLDASVSRVDGGDFHVFSAQAALIPFVTERLQLGMAPGYSVITGTQMRTIRNFGMAAIANYIFGGGNPWRGYIGGFGAANGGPMGARFTEIGAQAGALHFFDPAVVLRSEVRYRAPASGPGAGVGTVMFLLTLDPHLFGPANAAAIQPAGFGVVDVSGFVYHARHPSTRASGVSGSLAPYLTRWAQLGVDGQAVHFSEFGGFGAHRLRAFGRVYIPRSPRTQPFAESFAETSTFGSEPGGLTSFGGTLGARRMLNSRVALDFGVRRTLHPRRLTGFPDAHSTVRRPGTTDLLAGLAIRAGRPR